VVLGWAWGKEKSVRNNRRRKFALGEPQTKKGQAGNNRGLATTKEGKNQPSTRRRLSGVKTEKFRTQGGHRKAEKRQKNKAKRALRKKYHDTSCNRKDLRGSKFGRSKINADGKKK